MAIVVVVKFKTAGTKFEKFEKFKKKYVRKSSKAALMSLHQSRCSPEDADITVADFVNTVNMTQFAVHFNSVVDGDTCQSVELLGV